MALIHAPTMPQTAVLLPAGAFDTTLKSRQMAHF
jgi:hypothetical protein